MQILIQDDHSTVTPNHPLRMSLKIGAAAIIKLWLGTISIN